MSVDGQSSARHHDRTARLLRVEHLLYGNPRGLKPKELARRCGVCVRTPYRDLAALDQELGLVLWQDEGRYGLDRSMFLPPRQTTVAALAEKPQNPDFVRVFDVLTSAWANRRRVKIGYLWTSPDGAFQKGSLLEGGGESGERVDLAPLAAA